MTRNYSTCDILQVVQECKTKMVTAVYQVLQMAGGGGGGGGGGLGVGLSYVSAYGQ